MTNNKLPDAGHNDPRHTFLTSKEVIARFDCGRTYGYQMLKCPGFPAAIGGRYRLDTLMAWEECVLAGELPGHPDPQAGDPEGRRPARDRRHGERGPADVVCRPATRRW